MNEETKKFEEEEKMLSTLDNPFNPFTHFNQWKQWDEAKGYYTIEYLARVVDYSDCVTEEDKRLAREKAIESIIELNPVKIYCKVSKDEKVKPINVEEV